MIPYADEFEIVNGSDGFRLVHKVTRKELGEYFQAACRTPEWKSALIIFEKYKRQNGLQHKDLVELRKYLEGFAANRRAQGKKCSNDFLTQEGSAYLKKQLDEKRKTEYYE